MVFSALGKNSSVMSRLNAAISGDSAQDVETLLQVLRDTREDLTDIAVGLKGITHVGSFIAAGSFNQGIEDVRHLVWESTAAKSIRPTLELCPPPSPTCLVMM
jgi:anti-anti-sigma regulatory factor